MNLYLLEDFEDDPPPEVVLDGTYTFDQANALIGARSLRMSTDPNTPPYYFYYWHGIPLLTGSVRLEVTAAMNPGLRSFGIGWRIIKNGQLAIMFARVNYANGKIEVVQNTDPHVFYTVVTPIPLELRNNSPLHLFRLSLTVNVDTLSYEQVRLHDFTRRDGSNNVYEYPLTLPNNPEEYVVPDGMMIKINPQGSAGQVGTAWMDHVEVWN